MIEDGLWLITSVIIICVLLIVFPVMNTMEKQDAFIQMQLVDEVDGFLHDIKDKGHLRQSDYEQFVGKLAGLGNSFKIDISCKRRQFTPIYDDPLDMGTFNGKITAVYDYLTHEEIVAQLYAEGSAGCYYFKEGDLITVGVTSTLQSRSDKLREMILLTALDDPSFYVRLSGVVAHEAY